MNFDQHLEFDPDESLTADLRQVSEFTVYNLDWLRSSAAEVCAALRRGLASPYHYRRAAETALDLLALAMPEPRWKSWYMPIAEVVEQHSLVDGNPFESGFRTVIGDFVPLLGELESPSPLVKEDLLKAYTKLIKTSFYRQEIHIPSELLEQAQAVAKRLGDHLETSRLLYSLSVFYYHNGDFQLAEFFAKRAFAISQNVDDEAGTADAACSLAVIFRSTREYGKALFYIDKALQYEPAAKNQMRYATLYYETGVIRYRQDRYQEAILNFEKALAIFEEYEAAYQIAMTRQSMALNYLYMGVLDEAGVDLVAARDGWEQLGILFEWVNSFFVEADLEFRRKNYQECYRLLSKTVDKAYSLLEDTPARDDLLQLIERFKEENLRYVES